VFCVGTNSITQAIAQGYGPDPKSPCPVELVLVGTFPSSRYFDITNNDMHYGLAWRDRVFQPLSLFEVAIGLTRRYGAAPGQPLDRNGELIDVQQQVARAIEALGFLGLVGVLHLS